MRKINPEHSVIVFDLDDTLYSEYEYKLSGIRAVALEIGRLYPQFDAETLLRSIDPAQNDWLDTLCTKCSFNDSEKQAWLWVYRLHRPILTPYWPYEKLAAFTKAFSACALVTDGRSITQRLKLQALGIAPVFDEILISEAYRSEKPCDKRFISLENQYPESKRFIYIGDNIKKDFITPKKMGWLTIGLSASPHNIHMNNPNDFEQAYHPHYWIESLDELPHVFLSESS